MLASFVRGVGVGGLAITLPYCWWFLVQCIRCMYMQEEDKKNGKPPTSGNRTPGLCSKAKADKKWKRRQAIATAAPNRRQRQENAAARCGSD